MGSNLGAGDRTIPLPEEVHRRLSTCSFTDPDVASLLAIFTRTDETGSETSARSVIEDAETTKLRGDSQFALLHSPRQPPTGLITATTPRGTLTGYQDFLVSDGSGVDHQRRTVSEDRWWI
jgi:hypothetical protein